MPLDLEAYRAAFEAVPAPCLLLDDELVILAANAAYVQMVGRSSVDLVGKHVFDAFPANPDDPSGSQSVEHVFEEPEYGLLVEIPKGRSYGDDFYRDVAKKYSAAARAYRRPAKQIAEANGVPVATVHRWVKEARRRGFLGVARPGKAG